MQESADSSRRRELEQRAYAPGGGLSDAEAAELQTLTDRRAARRRELQRRAFAPGGALTDAETAELRELSAPAANAVVPPVGVPSAHMASASVSRSAGSAGPVREPGASVHDSDAAFRDSGAAFYDPGAAFRDSGAAAPDHTARSGSAPAPSASTTSSTAPASSASPASSAAPAPASTRPRRRWLAPLAAVLTLLLGFGAGWLAFGRDTGLTMTDAQRDVWVELQKATYDPGSVQLVGSKHGVDAWSATKQDGQQRCFILTAKDATSQSPTCRPADEDRDTYDMQASITVQEDGKNLMVWAVIAEDATGNPVVIMQRQDADAGWDWRSQYEPEELAIAEMIDSKGFSGDMLQIIGYDGETPIWLHQDSPESCILIATSTEIKAQACGSLDPQQAIELAMPGVTYSLRATEMRGPTLTVIRVPTAVLCDKKSGECTSIEDNTGALSE